MAVKTQKGSLNKKVLIADLSGDVPTFEFNDSWTGHDVRVILRHMWNAYKIHMRDVRRADAMQSQTSTAETTPPSQTNEEKELTDERRQEKSTEPRSESRPKSGKTKSRLSGHASK